jgi:hypothetical protein
MHQTSGMATLPPDNRYYQITNYKVCSFPSCCPWIFTALVGSHLWAWGYLQRWFLAICLKSRVYLLSTDPYHLLGNKNPAPCVSLCTCILSSCMCISTCAIHIYILYKDISSPCLELLPIPKHLDSVTGIALPLPKRPFCPRAVVWFSFTC